MGLMTDEAGQPATPSPTPREAEALRLARWLAAQPFNHDDTDKTWVLALMRRLERLFASAQRLPGRGPG